MSEEAQPLIPGMLSVEPSENHSAANPDRIASDFLLPSSLNIEGLLNSFRLLLF